jgi:hypothetical protein
VTVAHALTADEAWTAGEIGGIANTGGSGLLWTTMDGVLRVDVATGCSAWTTAPAFCQGPALVAPGAGTLVLSEGAALRLTGDQAHVVGGGFTGAGWLMPGPDGSAWVFTTQGPRSAEGRGGHTLSRLGNLLADSTSLEVDFAGRVHQAVLTR